MRDWASSNITLLLVMVCLGLGCVEKGEYERVKGAYVRLQADSQRNVHYIKDLTQYVDSILPLLTMNQPRNIREQVFPMVVKLSQVAKTPATSDPVVEPPSSDELDVINTLQGDLVALTQEGVLAPLEIPQEVSLEGITQEISRSRDYLWKEKNGVYTMVLSQEKFFDFQSTSLSTSGKQILARLARRFRHLAAYDIIVESHTDDTEAIKNSEGENSWALTAIRAARLVAYLEHQGVSSEYLLAVGRGHFDPYFSNSSESNKRKNRRVEIILRPKAQN